MTLLAAQWPFLVAGWPLILAGAALLAHALFRDRSQGRRRCPRCWYSMAGVPGLQCPECGHAARAEHRLLRTRRHWRRAGFASIALLIGASLLNVRAFQRGGVYALVPSSLLVRIAPADYQPQSGMGGAGAFLMRTKSGTLVKVTTPTPPGPPIVGPMLPAWKPSADLREEVWARLQWERLSPGQARIFLRRYMHGRTLGDVPERWIAGRYMPVRSPRAIHGLHTYLRCLGTEQWRQIPSAPNPRRDRAHLLTPADATETTLEHVFFIGKDPLFHGVHAASIELRPDESSLLDRISNPEIGPLLLGALGPRLVGDAKDFRIVLKDELVRHGIEFAVDIELTVLDGARVIGAGTASLTSGREVGRSDESVALTWSEQPVPDREYTLLLRGRPDVSTRRYLEDPFGMPAACWAGQLRTILRLERPTAPVTP